MDVNDRCMDDGCGWLIKDDGCMDAGCIAYWCTGDECMENRFMAVWMEKWMYRRYIY